MFPDTMRVNFGVALVQILDLDEVNEALTTKVWVRYVSSLPLDTWVTSGRNVGNFRSTWELTFGCLSSVNRLDQTCDKRQKICAAV